MLLTLYRIGGNLLCKYVVITCFLFYYCICEYVLGDMRMSNKMEQVQQERGKPLKQVLVELWDQHGSQQAVADELGVTQGTISLWMLRLGLTFKTVIVDDREPA